MVGNTELTQGLNPDLLNRVDQDLLNRLATVLSNMRTVEIRNNMLVGLQVTGDIKEFKGTDNEPLIHVEATVVKSASLITLTLVADDRSYNPETVNRMSAEQRLHLAFVAYSFNQKLNQAFGVVVNLNDLLNNGGSFSFIFDPNKFDRDQGGFEDLSKPITGDTASFEDL